MDLNILKELKGLYKKGENITSYLKSKQGINFNSSKIIEIAYDLQAGSYIKNTQKNEEFNYKYTSAIADVLNSFQFTSILEVGVGEATTLTNVFEKLNMQNNLDVYGFDISWSRIKYGLEYSASKGFKDFNLFTGDLFQIPILSNSIDVVYTSHSIEPNGGKEKEALKSLYGITKKYLILLEPSYEMNSDEGKQRMERLGYVKGIAESAKELGYNILEHRLFDYSANPLNPTAITIIQKEAMGDDMLDKELPFACPVTKSKMKRISATTFYCEESLLAYPVLENIPCLCPMNAIIASHLLC